MQCGICAADDCSAAAFLFKGIAVHAFLLGRIAFVGADIDHIQRAVVVAAKVVAALLNGAVNIRVLMLFHRINLLLTAYCDLGQHRTKPA